MENIVLSAQLIRDAIYQGTIWEEFREQVHFGRVVIPLTLDLTTLADQKDPFQNSEYQFVELSVEDLEAEKFPFSIRNRYFKALHKIARGLRGFVLVKDGTIIGDIWCLAPYDQNITIRHLDFERMGITSAIGDVFGIDMFIDPAYRGKKLAVPILLSAILILKREGRRRFNACALEGNIPAKWMHYMLKFKELPKYHTSRFFTIKKIKPAPTHPTN